MTIKRKKKSRDTFEFELEKCGFTESDIRIIKTLISKYAPKEQIPETILAERKITYAEVYGWNAYKAELFKELGLC